LFMVLLYTITASGFALNLHYCGDHVAAVQINAPAKSCVKPMGKMRCCKDTKLDIKVKDSHEAQQKSVTPKVSSVYLPKLTFGDLFMPARHSLAADLLFDHAPPDAPPTKGSVFIKNCAMRI
jgi:hypothetical protein